MSGLAAAGAGGSGLKTIILLKPGDPAFRKFSACGLKFTRLLARPTCGGSQPTSPLSSEMLS